MLVNNENVLLTVIPFGLALLTFLLLIQKKNKVNRRQEKMKRPVSLMLPREKRELQSMTQSLTPKKRLNRTIKLNTVCDSYTFPNSNITTWINHCFTP